MSRNNLILVLAAFWLILAGLVGYFLYAPRPEPPAGAVERVTIDVDGRERQFLVFSPSQLRPGAGVLLVFHPSRGSAGKMRRMVGHVLERIAARENLVVVYPEGYEGHFNDCRRVASYSARTLDIDDVAFSTRIVERLAAERSIDPASTYALGFSNGAHMVLRLAIEAPQLAKGAVVIAANSPTRENFACTTAASPSRRVVFVAGTRDPINPYQGGQVTLFGFGSRGTVNSAEDSAKWFADALELKVARPVTTVRNAGLEVRQQDWESPDAHVRLVTIEGGGHTIPQANYRFPRIFGATLRSDSVLESSLRVLLGAE